MGSYKVLFAKSVKQDVRGIDAAHLNRIMGEVRALGEDPFPSGCKRLKGSKTTYRIRNRKDVYR